MHTNNTKIERGHSGKGSTGLNRILLVVLILLIITVIILLLINHKRDKNTPATISPTSAPSKAVTPGETGTPSVTDALTPTPTPTPKIFGACSSVTKDVNAVPEQKDGWEIDFLMLVNWDNRLKYSGDPENLINLSDVLDPSLYHLQHPITVSAGSLDFVINEEDDKYLRGNATAVSALNELCLAIMAQGADYVKVSQTGAYRNFATQDRFWQNRISQDPHYGDDPYRTLPKTVPGNASEHRTGLGFDIWLGPGGDDSESYAWLQENAYRYGFILRYPSNKTKITGIQYERWHYRYVGKEAAEEIYNLGMCLEEYIAYKNGEPIPDGTHKPTPIPTATPTPEPTDTPTPSVTPADTPTPDTTPTPTSKPTDTPIPTPDSSKEPTPTPDATPTPVPTPDATPTPVPNATPTPVPTPDSSKEPTPTPDATPTPVPTPDPAEEPTPTPTPIPEPTKDPWGGQGSGFAT